MSPSLPHSTAAHLSAAAARLTKAKVLVGFDGFVDTILHVVAQRESATRYTRLGQMRDFAGKVGAAAGLSANFEFVTQMVKLGGNGPIMANALLAAGTKLTYIGALGHPNIHPVFQDMASRARAISLCAAAATTAVEFTDGKVMFGQMKSLDEITYAKIVEVMGRDEFHAQLAAADLVALVNWTMIPNMSAIFAELTSRVLPTLPKRDRIFFFDLADPEKRSAADLVDALEKIAAFEQFGRVTLGLNLKEAQQVFAALGFGQTQGEDEPILRLLASEIRKKLGVSTVVVHPRKSAACATADATYWVPGPYVEQPLITTGAGDHFNAGFSVGQLLGLTPESCLATGVSTSGHYVRTAQSPTLADLQTFLANWN